MINWKHGAATTDVLFNYHLFIKDIPIESLALSNSYKHIL
jgi:hypothetical protein